MATTGETDGNTGIVPGYGWFGTEYKPVWRVFIDGRQVGGMDENSAGQGRTSGGKYGRQGEADDERDHPEERRGSR